MNDEYKVVKKFECHGKLMVTVKSGSAAHVMGQDEWHKVYEKNHQDGWKKKVNRNRFSSRIEYNKKDVS